MKKPGIKTLSLRIAITQRYSDRLKAIAEFEDTTVSEWVREILKTPMARVEAKIRAAAANGEELVD